MLIPSLYYSVSHASLKKKTAQLCSQELFVFQLCWVADREDKEVAAGMSVCPALQCHLTVLSVPSLGAGRKGLETVAGPSGEVRTHMVKFGLRGTPQLSSRAYMHRSCALVRKSGILTTTENC